jgi:phage terminase large subunit-like protein
MSTRTRQLSSVARHVVQPAGIVSTGWPRIAGICDEKLGLTFDTWQDGAGRLILAKCADGQLAATIGGVGMSLPRQVGKTTLLIGLIFGLCLDHPGLFVIWTSHHSRTTAESFLTMQSFTRRTAVRPLIGKVFLGAGDEEIRFTNGSRILFGAREHGFGRGLSGVDAIIFDEGQILSERALQNMLASLNMSKLGLHIYCGTPPKPTDNSESFSRMRADALSGEAADLAWVEFSADEDADLDDPAQWAKANPSYPHWTPAESIKRLRRKLDPDGFRREALGIWPSDRWRVFDIQQWVRLADADVREPRQAVLAIDVSPYRGIASIGVAGETGGKTLLLAHSGEGTDWVADKVAQLVAGRDIAEVSLTPGAARGLEPDLTRVGVAFKKLNGTDIAASCAAFQEAVKGGSIIHVGQPALDMAVSSARTRRVGDSETWDRGFTEDVSPLVACAAAAYRLGVLASAPYDILLSVL